MFTGILLIVLGILAIPSLLLAKKPNAKELIDKITPYQGIIGVVFFIWGIWGVIGAVLSVGYWFSWGLFGIIYWVLILAVGLVELALGFMMGYGLIAKYALSKNETAKAKGEEMRAKLAPMQGKLGIAAIIVGVACIVMDFVVAGIIVAATI